MAQAWICEVCTFAHIRQEEHSYLTCAMCGAPRQHDAPLATKPDEQDTLSMDTEQAPVNRANPTHTPDLERTNSGLVASVTGVSRQIARLAIDSAGGDINLAVSNLLLGLGDQPPVLELASSHSDELELAQLGGVTQEQARMLLESANGNLEQARQSMLRAFVESAEDVAHVWQEEKLIEPGNKSGKLLECPLCCDEVCVEDTVWLHQCGHRYCRACLQRYVKVEMSGKHLSDAITRTA